MLSAKPPKRSVANGASFRSRPSDAARLSGIASGQVNAVFDEGIKSWAGDALEHGFRFLPIDGAIRERLAAMGFRPVTMSAAEIPGLPEDVPTLDFSGFTVYTHANAPDEVITFICRALEARKDRIPRDTGEGPLPLDRMCRDTVEGPLTIPLHPAAERFWREQGYLS